MGMGMCMNQCTDMGTDMPRLGGPVPAVCNEEERRASARAMCVMSESKVEHGATLDICSENSPIECAALDCACGIIWTDGWHAPRYDQKPH